MSTPTIPEMSHVDANSNAGQGREASLFPDSQSDEIQEVSASPIEAGEDIITLSNSNITETRGKLITRVRAKYQFKVETLVANTEYRNGVHSTSGKTAHERIKGVAGMLEQVFTLQDIIGLHKRHTIDVFKAVRKVLFKEYAQSKEYYERMTEPVMRSNFLEGVLNVQKRRVMHINAAIKYCAGLIEELEGLPLELRRQKMK